MRSLLHASSIVVVALSSAAGVAINVIPKALLSQILVPPDRTVTIGVMSNGPVPTGVTVTGTPTVAKVSWQPVSGAVKYSVTRAKDGDPACCNAQVSDITATSWTDNGNGSGIQSSGTYSYTVVAWQSTGVYGQTIVKWTRPEPVNPSGFSAKQTGEGTAELSWQAVRDASSYQIWGPGTPAEGIRVDGTAKILTGIGSGMKEWSITTKYDPAGFLLPASTWPKTQLNMVAVSGTYRITLNGFQVVSPAKEALVTLDGAGNEVFALAYVRTYDRATGSVLNEGSVESAVHGDTEGFVGRVPAGSAKPTGGLIAGDKFPGATPWLRGNSVSATTFPLLLWEGQLTNAKEAVVVTPMIWEWNGTSSSNDPALVDAVNKDQKNNTANLWSTVSSALSGAGQTWSGPTQIPLEWQYPALLVMAGSYAQEGMEFLSRAEERIHAIGADTPSPANKKLYIVRNTGIVFTRELIEKALSGQGQIGGMGPGVIEVKWTEKFPTGVGNYTLYVQVARQ